MKHPVRTEADMTDEELEKILDRHLEKKNAARRGTSGWPQHARRIEKLVGSKRDSGDPRWGRSGARS